MLRWSIPQVLANYTGGKIMRIFPKVFKTAMEKAQLPLSEMARVAGVSARQIRYWEKKGYITSHQAQKNQNHKFNFFSLLKVMEIKEFLDEGYTLQAAVEKQRERQNILRSVRRLISERLLGVEEVAAYQEGVEINLGPLDNDETKIVVAQVKAGQPVKLILKKHQPID